MFKLVLNLPILANEVKIDVFSPLNASSVMTLCNIRLLGYGSNFACLDMADKRGTLTESEIDSGYSKGHLDLGFISNASRYSFIIFVFQSFDQAGAPLFIE